MPRPRKDSGPSATERMEGAFFTLLETTQFKNITVNALVATAGVNRNSFYYHYADLEDLAAAAAQGLTETSIPRLLATGLGPDSDEVNRAIEGLTRDRRILKILTVTGPNSTAELRNILKDAIMDLWLELFELERTDLTDEAQLTLHFVLGGMLEVMSRTDPGNVGTQLQTIREHPIRIECANILISQLHAAAAAKRSREDEVER